MLLRRDSHPALRDMRRAAEAVTHDERRQRLIALLDAIEARFLELDREVTRKSTVT